MSTINIDNHKVSDKPWGDVSKTELSHKLLEAGDAAAIHECYLYVGKPDEVSTWKFPHHCLEGNTLVVSRGGVHAAAQRLVSGGDTASSIPDKKAAARHLLKHYKDALKEDPPESLKELAKNVSVSDLEAMIVSTKTLLESCQKIGVDTDSLEKTLKSFEEELEAMKASPIFNPFVPTISIEATASPTQLSGEDEEARVTSIIKTKGLDISYAGSGMLLKRKSVPFQLVKESGEVIEVDKASPTKRKRHLEDYRPTEEELTAINKLSQVDVLAKDVYAWECLAADQNVDSHFEHFLSPALQDMKDGDVDNPIQLDHNPSVTVTQGKIFDSRVANKKLYEKFFTIDTPGNEDLNKKLAFGLLNKVSVGVLIPLSDYTCDLCKCSIVSSDCPHMPGMVDKESGKTVTVSIGRVARKLETSLVFSPAQFAAGIRRSMSSEQLGETSSFDTISTETKSVGDHVVSEAEANKDNATPPQAAEQATTTEAPAAVTETAKSEETVASTEATTSETEVSANKAKDTDADGDMDKLHSKLKDVYECMKSIAKSVEDAHEKLDKAHEKLDAHAKKMDEMSAAVKANAEKTDSLKSAVSITQEDVVKSVLASLQGVPQEQQVAAPVRKTAKSFADVFDNQLRPFQGGNQ